MAGRRRGRPKISAPAGLDPRVMTEVAAIALVLAGVVILFSVFGNAGVFGQAVGQLVRTIFGDESYLLPIVFFVAAAALIRPDWVELRGVRLIGLVLLLIGIPSLLHLIPSSDFSYTYARAGQFGGMIGYVVDSQLRAYLGNIVTIIAVLSLVAVGILLTFRVSVSQLIDLLTGRLHRDGELEGGTVNINQPKVSVFQTIKRSLTSPREETMESKATEAPVVPMSRTGASFVPPPLELLEEPGQVASSGNITKNVDIIQKALKNFGIEVAMQDVNIGPTVTQYTLKPHEGVKLNQITARAKDLELALSAKSLRMEAPIPGKGSVGVEIPNKIAARVTLKEILLAPEFKKEKSRLALGLGRDVAGSPVIVDLERMPHLLIAGATGSGKSVCINAILLNLLYRNSPAELRFIMVDPKRVELTNYNGISHLLCPVITDPQKTINALKWTVAEMERRYQLFSETGRRNIAAYNANPTNGPLPYLVVVIDELADLMAVASADVEASIVRLAQLARATGIHLIVATQRPSVDVLTGLIKANITSRIAFAVASQVDSRTILDVGGAEKLLGNGDMLFISNEYPKPKRVQGIFPSDKEINSTIDFIQSHNSPAETHVEILEYRAPSQSGAQHGGEEDPLFDEAIDVIVAARKASASLLQRRLKVGYARAARLLDLLEEAGIIGPGDGAKPRDVLVSATNRPQRSLDGMSSHRSFQSPPPSSERMPSEPSQPPPHTRSIEIEQDPPDQPEESDDGEAPF